MSECVVRMEMPRNCHECPVSYQSFGDTPCWCKLAFEKNESVSDGLMWRETDPTKRPSWCPIICSLPEGHGRLVDERELFERCRPVKNFDNPDSLVIVMGAVIQSQTIVPAEPPKEDA